jgi:hypothetical protein
MRRAKAKATALTMPVGRPKMVLRTVCVRLGWRAVWFGAVAQLGERRVRNAKVEGSTPFRSTIKHPLTAVVSGCFSFREGARWHGVHR